MSPSTNCLPRGRMPFVRFSLRCSWSSAIILSQHTALSLHHISLQIRSSAGFRSRSFAGHRSGFSLYLFVLRGVHGLTKQGLRRRYTVVTEKRPNSITLPVSRSHKTWSHTRFPTRFPTNSCRSATSSRLLFVESRSRIRLDMSIYYLRPAFDPKMSRAGWRSVRTCRKRDQKPDLRPGLRRGYR